MDHPPRERVGGRAPGQRRDRQAALRGGQHQVAEPAAAQHRRIGHQAGLRKDRAHRRDLRPRMRQRRPVADIHGIQARGAERPGHGGGKLSRRQMRGRARPGEQIRYHHIKGRAANPLNDSTGVAGPDPQPARPGPGRPAPARTQRQLPPDQFHQRGIRLRCELAGAGPGRRHVPGQGQPPAPQMQHPQCFRGRRRQVDQVAEPPHVLELQVLRIVEVNVGLRGAVHQQGPAPGPVPVTDELGDARVDALPDDPRTAAAAPVRHNHHCPALPGRRDRRDGGEAVADRR